MRGGWHGFGGTAGGLTRTYGLQDHFSREDQNGPPPRIARGSVRRVARYFSPYRGAWAAVLGCIVTAAGLNVLPPLCVAGIIDRGIPHGDIRLVALLAAAMVGLATASGLLGVLQHTLTARAGQNIMHDLRDELFGHLQKMSLGFYTSTRSGEVVSRLSNDVNAVQNVATGTLVTITSNLVTLTVTAVTLFGMNWKLALCAVAVVPAFYIPSRVVGRIRRRLATATQESQAAMLTFLNERLHVGGVLLTNIYGQRRADGAEFSATSGRVRDLNIRQAIVGRWLFMILSVFSAVGPALIYWAGGFQAIRGEVTTGRLVAFAALLTLLYRPMVQLATVYVDVQASVAVFERIFEYLDLRPEVADPAEPFALPAVRGHLRFEGVAFAYPRPLAVGGKEADAAEPFALKNLSFEVPPGRRVALVGPSGSGKTTTTYLVPRLYDPVSGRITLDGHDLRDLAQEDLRRHIGMVTQETFLFHTSIRENLRYARPEATEEQIIEACRAARIHDFIASLPRGYDTLVGERGFRLSGGEKQRVSIARALLKDPAILILDEATSSLDATSEHLIQVALEKLLEGRTSLIIAHRLSTILRSDRIVVMNGGGVVDSGTHGELLARGGLYAQLFRQQFGAVLEHGGRAAS